MACSVNGRRFEADSPAALANRINDDAESRLEVPLSLPFSAGVQEGALCLTMDASLARSHGDCSLVGAVAEDAIAKADRVIAEGDMWRAPLGDVDVRRQLSSVDGGWGGPLIVSMPRTGSTLFGTLFLMASNPPGSTNSVFARYIHEPVGPVFWQGRGLEATAEIVGPELTARDIVQESAYQFASSAIAKWFLERARPPVVFLVRHPQRAWPSRWRVMLRMMRADVARRSDWERIDAALLGNDFRDVGDLLTARVRPPDNGWFAFLAAIDVCRNGGIEHLIIDNTRFRDHPEETLREVSRRWGLPFDNRMTTWQTLDDVQDRVVMGEMARTAEYEWYYARTLGSRHGIIRVDDELLDPALFPPELRGVSTDGLTIDEAVTWYRALLTRPEVLD